jgi:hypothetical protein
MTGGFFFGGASGVVGLLPLQKESARIIMIKMTKFFILISPS